MISSRVAPIFSSFLFFSGGHSYQVFVFFKWTTYCCDTITFSRSFCVITVGTTLFYYHRQKWSLVRIAPTETLPKIHVLTSESRHRIVYIMVFIIVNCIVQFVITWCVMSVERWNLNPWGMCERARCASQVGIATGNPGVSQPIPVPVPAETRTLGHGYGFFENPWVPIVIYYKN